jgi:hypothetical protein
LDVELGLNIQKSKSRWINEMDSHQKNFAVAVIVITLCASEEADKQTAWSSAAATAAAYK